MERPHCQLSTRLTNRLRRNNANSLTHIPFENYQIIRKELVNYGAQIENKKEIIALNKIEIMEKEEVAKIQQEFEKKLDQKVLLISAATGYQLDQLTNLCLEYLQDE